MQRIFSEIMHLKERTKYQSAKQKEREEEKKMSHLKDIKMVKSAHKHMN